MIDWFLSLPSVIQWLAYAAVGCISFYYASQAFNHDKGGAWKALGVLLSGVVIGSLILAYFSLPAAVQGATNYVSENGQKLQQPARPGFAPAEGDAPAMGE